jgi:hypothetical protein
MVTSQSNITCCHLVWYLSLVQCVTEGCNSDHVGMSLETTNIEEISIFIHSN